MTTRAPKPYGALYQRRVRTLAEARHLLMSLSEPVTDLGVMTTLTCPRDDTPTGALDEDDAVDEPDEY